MKRLVQRILPQRSSSIVTRHITKPIASWNGRRYVHRNLVTCPDDNADKLSANTPFFFCVAVDFSADSLRAVTETIRLANPIRRDRVLLCSVPTAPVVVEDFDDAAFQAEIIKRATDVTADALDKLARRVHSKYALVEAEVTLDTA